MKTVLALLCFISITGCADIPDYNFYSYYGGYQVISGAPMPTAKELKNFDSDKFEQSIKNRH
jgi:hypothetical protein